MDVNERILSIGNYFALFNVHDGIVFLGIHLPEKWTLFDTSAICDEFGIQITTKENVTYFLCEIEDGFEPVFDAVDFIIAQNKALEEKTELLRSQVEILRSLFEKEPLEKLKTLRFVFDDTLSAPETVTLPVDIKQQLKKKDKQQTKNTKDCVIPNNVETAPTDNVPVDKPAKKKPRKTNNNDSSLMNFVKDELENE